ncbi:LPS-assembly protein LptD [Cohaesibacter gelatinilyticus]|uniref:LPS-assembly protein LptD n=1 Tax=Cohaesibacter gelatinilyticus TaxID=372072 RepID=A0A285NF29_9HYPH|nr:LPS-assembly protein LptD [Cohaesibacter gelatinilyticus]SNZ08059.1 LPS-assembly protein [Cohaesibacter gelatinilyticus]
MWRTVHDADNRVNLERSGQMAGLRAILLASAAIVLPLSVSMVLSTPLHAQSLTDSVKFQADPDARMLVEADQMVYDYDRERVSAVGNVQIYYGQYALQADKVTYDQASARLIAEGSVQITEPDGNVVTANHVDITDDFRTGFVRSLRVKTPENARFAAERAERKDDDITVFDKGVYTTCEPCRDNPNKSPVWQIKASRIIYNSKDKMVYYKAAKLEFLGIPLLYTPYFAHPDPSRKRKSGILTPSAGFDSKLGYHATVPYFWALSDSYDVTFSPTYYTKQGLLAETTWRQHLGTGIYSVKFSGINQQDPSAFAGTSGDQRLRGAVQTEGSFNLNKQWKFGWDVSVISDKRFLRDYGLIDRGKEDTLSTVYLTGQGERNHFDARANYYNIMTDSLSQSEQAIAHPVIDYSAYAKNPILGGEGRLKINSTSLTRDDETSATVGNIKRTYGLAGSYNRTSAEVSWKKKIVAVGGQVITPFTSLRGDFYWMPSKSGAPAALVDDSVAVRGMPTVGIDYRLPILVQTANTSHIIEPIAQVIVRPNEAKIGELPNDDSQSLIFDDSILFDPNKFSGYDRLEGGTRANIGFQYRMQLANGWSVNALAGQSIQIAGTNSFSKQDLTSTGLASGLDAKKSDYVARVGLNSGKGIQGIARGRFDSKSGKLKYAATEASGTYGRYSGSLGYSYTDKRPSAGINEIRQEITASAAVKLHKFWSLSGAARYDIANKGLVSSNIGLQYDDECFAVSLKYEHSRDIYSDIDAAQSIKFQFNLKSIGGADFKRDLN